MTDLKYNDRLVKLGNKIHEIRKAKGLSQSELSADIEGWFKSHISEIEAGKRNLSTISLMKIADALGVEIKDLFDFD